MNPANHIHGRIAALEIALQRVGDFLKGVRVVAARKPVPQLIVDLKLPRVADRQRETGPRRLLLVSMGEAAVFAIGAAGGLKDLGGRANAPALADLDAEANGAAGGKLPIRIAGLASHVGWEGAEVHVDLGMFFMDEADGGAGEDREPSLGI